MTKHTLATTMRFSLSPGEKTLLSLPFFSIYLNNILPSSPTRNYKFISFEVKTSQTRSRPIIAELIRKFRNTRRPRPILPEFFRLVPREFALLTMCFSVSFSNRTTSKSIILYFYIFFLNKFSANVFIKV